MENWLKYPVCELVPAPGPGLTFLRRAGLVDRVVGRAVFEDELVGVRIDLPDACDIKVQGLGLVVCHEQRVPDNQRIPFQVLDLPFCELVPIHERMTDGGVIGVAWEVGESERMQYFDRASGSSLTIGAPAIS